jgi:hypothetical protein
MTEFRSVTIAQLPFPSTADPHPLITAYYQDYAARFAELINSYFVPEGALWEMPLWAAHLAGILKAIKREVTFEDLSDFQPSADACTQRLMDATCLGDVVMFSPLAQNFSLVKEVSRRLLREGRRTIIGGNMAPLAGVDSATAIYNGILDTENLRRTLNESESGEHLLKVQFGRRGSVAWNPDYRILSHYAGKVPLLRLNASHGCLFECRFCGDAWSRKLYVVPASALEAEVRQFEQLFPDTRLIYIGDKTFGQSQEAISNLLQVFEERRQYRFIVQSHITLLDERLIDTMKQLGVVAIEIGFESGDALMLQKSGKSSPPVERYEAVLERLNRMGIRVVLNILGSLPLETPQSHDRTVATIQRWDRLVWLYNLYNFVPYPLTPYFEELRDRIFNWEFSAWREDAPPVFMPYYQSVDASWAAFLEKVRVAHSVIKRRSNVALTTDNPHSSASHSTVSAVRSIISAWSASS